MKAMLLRLGRFCGRCSLTKAKPGSAARARGWFCAVALMLAASLPSQADTILWTGTGGLIQKDWSYFGNWSPRPPQNGDTLVFSFSPFTNFLIRCHNDLPNLEVAHIKIYNPVEIDGNPIRVSGSISFYNYDRNYGTFGLDLTATDDFSIYSENTNIVTSAVNLNGHKLTIESTEGALKFSGAISGNGDLAVQGSVRFTGSSANSYSGDTTVHGDCVLERTTGPVLNGRLSLSAPGFGLPGSTTLSLLGPSQIQGNNPLRLDTEARLELNSYSLNVASIAMTDAQIEATTGGLELEGGITNSGTSEILANLTLSSASHFINVTTNARLTIKGDISGAFGSITKTGPGRCRLKDGNNTYGSLTTVNEGQLIFENCEPGDDGIATLINGTGQVILTNAVVSGEPLTINTTHDPTTNGALVAEGISEWNGRITLSQSAALQAVGELRAGGRITGGGDLHLIGNTIRLTGTTGTNDYTGHTWVRATNVFLQGVGLTRILFPGAVDVVSNATLRLNGHDQFTGLDSLKIAEGGLLDLDGFNATLQGQLTLLGNVTTDGGTLTLNGQVTAPKDAHPNLSGKVSLSGEVIFHALGGASLNVSAQLLGSGGFRKTGNGLLRLYGNNTYGGATFLDDGETELSSGATFGTGNLGGVFLRSTLELDNGFEFAKSLTIVSNSVLELPAGTNVWLGPVTNHSTCALVVGPSANLIFGSPVYGSGTFYGGSNHLGRTSLATPGTNGFNGTMEFIAGQLYFNSSNAPSLGSGATLRLRNNAVCRLEADDQLSHNTQIELHDTSLLDFNHFTDRVTSLLLNGGDVSTGNGLLELGGDITRTDTGNNTSVISGRVLLTNGTHTINVANNGVVQMDARLGGNPDLVKSGPGFLSLTASNSFNGALVINDGLVFASHAAALGGTNGATLVNGTGVLELWGGNNFGGEAIALNSTGNGQFPPLVSGGGNNRVDGPVTLAAATGVKVFASTTLRLDGPISGSGNLAKFDTGTLHFTGSEPNTFTGDVMVGAGSLQLAKTVANAAVLGNITIGDRGSTASLFLSGGEQIADTANVTLDSNGTLDLTPSTGGERFARLQGSGHIDLGDETISVMNGALASTFSGDISGAGGLVKEGTARLRLTGVNSYTGPTDINAGSLQVSGSLLASPVRVNSGGTFGGKGTVGQVTVLNGGTLAPGESPGALTVGSNLTFRTGSTLAVELDGPTAGTEFDQIIAQAGVFITNANLTAALHFAPTNGQRFRLIEKLSAGAIAGTFSGLPNGGSFDTNGVGFTANYATGTGNDFALVVNSTPATNPPVVPLRFTAITKLGNGNIKLEGAGQTNQPIVIEFSDNFEDWTELGTRPVNDGSFSIQDANPNTSPRFYRARRQ